MDGNIIATNPCCFLKLENMFLVRVFVVVPLFRNAENSENVVEFLSSGCLMSQNQHTGMFAQDPPNPLDRIRINYLLIWRQTLVILLMDRIRFASLGCKQLLSIRSFFFLFKSFKSQELGLINLDHQNDASKIRDNFTRFSSPFQLNP